MKPLCSLLISIILLTAAGCAGYRSGLASIPYVGDVEPTPKAPETSYELGELKWVHLPGVELKVSLNKTIGMSDRTVMLVVVPMSLDPRDKPDF